MERCNKSRSTQKELLSKETAERWRLTYCSSLKNYMAHASVDGFINILTDNTESDKLQALAWFTHSYRKADIMQACDRLVNDKSLSAELREEAKRTYYRLKD